jgi:hypothetical protein
MWPQLVRLFYKHGPQLACLFHKHGTQFVRYLGIGPQLTNTGNRNLTETIIKINFKTGTFICIYLKIETSPGPTIFVKFISVLL